MGHYNGANGNDSNIVQSVIGATAQTWSSPVYFNNQIYLQPSSSSMRAYTITNGHIATPASSIATASFGTYNGGPVVSANGTNDGIVWVLNGAGGNGTEVLYAYSATNIAKQLYNSSQLSRDIPGNGIKMISPTVANGKVYVGAQFALSIYGLNAFLATPTISPNGAAFTNSVLVTLGDHDARRGDLLHAGRHITDNRVHPLHGAVLGDDDGESAGDRGEIGRGEQRRGVSVLYQHRGLGKRDRLARPILDQHHRRGVQ